MNRREWMQSAGLLSAALASPLLDQRPLWGAPSGADLQTEVKRLKLRHTWTTTMSSSEYRDTLHVRYTNQGITGVGRGRRSSVITKIPKEPVRLSRRPENS